MPQFLFPDAAGARMGLGEIQYHMQAPFAHVGSSADVYPPLSQEHGMVTGAKNQSVPGERPQSGMWQHRRTSNSLGRTELDTETIHLTAWQGVK